MIDKLMLDMDRCDVEIERATSEVMKSVETGGAWLGLHDWLWERRIIVAQMEKLRSDQQQLRAMFP
jgi:hypothetical protein